MGPVFLEHLGGIKLFCCKKCRTNLTNRAELVKEFKYTEFTGPDAGCFLFNRVVNITYSKVQDRDMLNGLQMVRDVSCKTCDLRLGVMCEYAQEEKERYREGKVTLQQHLLTEVDGMVERYSTDSA